MRYYSRAQIVQILQIEESFLIELEREEIIFVDEPASRPEHYSDDMLERARVADNLVHELEVNLAGAAVILRMREDLATLRRCVESLAGELRKRR